MPRKKRPNPAATSGWEGEARQEDIDRAIGSHVRLDGPRTYCEAHDAVKRMKAAGKTPDEIREALRRPRHKQEYSTVDTPQRADQKKIHNSVEGHLTDAARQGVEDALADRPAKYAPPPSY